MNETKQFGLVHVSAEQTDRPDLGTPQFNRISVGLDMRMLLSEAFALRLANDLLSAVLYVRGLDVV